MDGWQQVQIHEREFVLNHFRTAALVTGDPKHRQLLMFHGWLDNAASFQRVMHELPDHYCVALDFPGHGHADHFPKEVSYDFMDLVTFMDDAVEFFGSPLDIVGHSLGGAAATLFAAARPEKVRTLILIDSLGPMTDVATNTTARLREHLQARLAHRLNSKKFASIEDAVKYRVGSSVIPTSESAAAAIVGRGTRMTSQGWEWTHDARLKWPSAYRLSEEQLGLVIGDIQCPVLLIRAEPGVGMPADRWEARISRIRNLKYHLVTGTHHIHIDAENLVAKHIHEFLALH